MEALPCAQDVSRHAASLLMSLNHQRQRAHFCDCVVRQRQNPGQLYPAHRCVLAASSPVLASILSSTGVLVELQASCLSGSVLAHLLDYIYMGTLPYIHSQQHYYSLLSAACYLQMGELQEALRVQQQTAANDADKTNDFTGTENQPYEDIIDTQSETTNSCIRYLPLTCRRREGTDTCHVQSMTSSLGRDDHQLSLETCDEAQMPSASTDMNGREMDTRETRSINGANVSPCSIDLSEYCTESTQVTYLTSQDLMQNIPCTAEVCGVSREDKEKQRDLFHPAATVKPETGQKSTEEERVRTVEDRRNSSSSSSSSTHPCCGAVPVIRHSSRAALLQLAEVSTVSLYCPVSPTLVNSSRPPVSRSTSADSDSIVEGISTKRKNHYSAQNQDYRNSDDQLGTQCRHYQNSSSQSVTSDLCYKSSTDQSDLPEQDYNSSNADYYMKQNYEHMDNGLSLITDHNGLHAHCEAPQNKNHTKDLRDDSVPQDKLCSNFISGLKYDHKLIVDHLHQRMDWSNYQSVSMSASTEKLSQDARAVVPPPVEGSDTGRNFHCEDLCPEGDTKEEHSYSSRCQAGINEQDQCLASTQYKHDSDNRAMEEKRHRTDVCLSFPSTPESSLDNPGLFASDCRTSLELEKISGTEIREPRFTSKMPVDDMCNAVGQSYHGHLHYECLPQEDTDVLQQDSDHKHSHPSNSDYSDQSSEEEATETFVSPDCSSPRQHFAPGMTDKVLLLDISAKPAELLVSYKHRCEAEEEGVTLCRNDTFATGVRGNHRQQSSEATSVRGVEERDNRARTEFEVETFDEGESKFGVGDTNVEKRKRVCKSQSMPGLLVIHKAGVMEKEVSNHKEGENQGGTMTICSPPSVPASMSFTSSVCIPSTLSTGMPTNISAHLSTPLHHPFQCSLCERSFSQRGSLNRHVRSHLGVRPFPCPRCPMTFSRQYRVTEHMRVHQRCTMGNDFQKPPASSI